MAGAGVIYRLAFLSFPERFEAAVMCTVVAIYVLESGTFNSES